MDLPDRLSLLLHCIAMMASLNSYVLYIHIEELKYYNHPNIFSISLPG